MLTAYSQLSKDQVAYILSRRASRWRGGTPMILRYDLQLYSDSGGAYLFRAGETLVYRHCRVVDGVLFRTFSRNGIAYQAKDRNGYMIDSFERQIL